MVGIRVGHIPHYNGVAMKDNGTPLSTAVFECNYNSLMEVVALAKRMGRGLYVIKHADRTNYNITHKSRPDRWNVDGCEVIYDTDTHEYT